MSYTGQERRKSPRVCERFIISYRPLEQQDSVHTTQTKNLSLGGMLITTNRRFEPDTKLALEACLPFDPNPITVIARVADSQEIIKDLIYDTHLEFLEVDKGHKKAMAATVDYYLKKETG